MSTRLRKRRPRWPALGIAWCLGACTTAAGQPQLALLVDPTPDSRAELRALISAALHVDSIVLADDALTKESQVSIDRVPARDAAGTRLSGRDYGRPEHFQLWKDGSACVLVRQRSGERFTLTKSRCAAADDTP